MPTGEQSSGGPPQPPTNQPPFVVREESRGATTAIPTTASGISGENSNRQDSTAAKSSKGKTPVGRGKSGVKRQRKSKVIKID